MPVIIYKRPKIRPLVLILVLTLISSCALLSPNKNRHHSSALELMPFKSDYCSKWPDGYLHDPDKWSGCCFTHDLSYWVGGSEKEKEQSDKLLRSCIKLKADSINSFLMYIGVTVGGSPGEASYSWGYGWSKNRKYFERSKEDNKAARDLLQADLDSYSENEKNLILIFLSKHLQ